MGPAHAAPSDSGSTDLLDSIKAEQAPASTKMAKKSLFEDSDSDSFKSAQDNHEDGGANLDEPSLKINKEYARRFEHNKKREERQRLEEKFKTQGRNEDESDSESSSDEAEDEDGFLATEALDAEISATLQAIKNNDPSIYDQNVRFITSIDEDGQAAPKEKKEKPVFLRDYHRERYMAGDTGTDDVEDADAPRPKTFVQEQDDLKKELLSEINAEVAKTSGGDDEDGFMKAKESEAPAGEDGLHPSRRPRVEHVELDPALADKDPELYLSNFMASRAWILEKGSKWEAFESDEGEGNDDADEWEAAYNLRFEDPAKSNEVLKSYSRKIVEARTVRHEQATGRKRQRELEKERKEAEKRERHEERARLKRLKVEEAEEKLQKIKKAAGISGKELREDEWMKLLEGSWENDKWEEEMDRRFGEHYYAEADVESEDSEEEAGDKSEKKKKKRKVPKKPKWDDDIDIKDIIPDFDDELSKPNISLSDSEPEAADDGQEDSAEDDPGRPSKKCKTTRDHKLERLAAKRAARQERSKIEALVDARMELDDPSVLSHATSSNSKKADVAPFHYRETSPTSFGLTARDILLAPSDAALNEFVGLKRLATFRDAEKKRKDKKRLGKKARLREWRREVFGREYEHTGPTFGFGDDKAGGEDAVAAAVEQKADEIAAGEGKKKRKRSKNKKRAVTV